jgi:hypothetical protein
MKKLSMSLLLICGLAVMVSAQTTQKTKTTQSTTTTKTAAPKTSKTSVTSSANKTKTTTATVPQKSTGMVKPKHKHHKGQKVKAKTTK